MRQIVTKITHSNISRLVKHTFITRSLTTKSRTCVVNEFKLKCCVEFRINHVAVAIIQSHARPPPRSISILLLARLELKISPIPRRAARRLTTLAFGDNSVLSSASSDVTMQDPRHTSACHSCQVLLRQDFRCCRRGHAAEEVSFGGEA